MPRRFRMVIYQIEEYLTLDQEYHGVVSPGEWVYHSYSVPYDGSPHNFTFHLVKHTGDLEIVVRHDYIPLKLVPPFVHVGENQTEEDTQVCNSLPGEKVYLGMLGGGHAASYEIIASELPVGVWERADDSTTCLPLYTSAVEGSRSTKRKKKSEAQARTFSEEDALPRLERRSVERSAAIRGSSSIE